MTASSARLPISLSIACPFATCCLTETATQLKSSASGSWRSRGAQKEPWGDDNPYVRGAAGALEDSRTRYWTHPDSSAPAAQTKPSQEISKT